MKTGRRGLWLMLSVAVLQLPAVVIDAASQHLESSTSHCLRQHTDDPIVASTRFTEAIEVPISMVSFVTTRGVVADHDPW